MEQFCVLGQKALITRCFLGLVSPGVGAGVAGCPLQRPWDDHAFQEGPWWWYRTGTMLPAGLFVWCCAWGHRRGARLRSVACPAVPSSGRARAQVALWHGKLCWVCSPASPLQTHAASICGICFTCCLSVLSAATQLKSAEPLPNVGCLGHLGVQGAGPLG